MILKAQEFLTIAFLFHTAAEAGRLLPKKRIKRLVDLKDVAFSFDCTNRAVGFYADVEHNCQIFHMCDEKGKRVPHTCANDTSFNQEFRICDWEYNFECSDAPKWFYLNELTYAKSQEYEDYDLGNVNRDKH